MYVIEMVQYIVSKLIEGTDLSAVDVTQVSQSLVRDSRQHWNDTINSLIAEEDSNK